MLVFPVPIFLLCMHAPLAITVKGLFHEMINFLKVLKIISILSVYALMVFNIFWPPFYGETRR